MREAECARSNLAEDLSRLRMELEKVTPLMLAQLGGPLCDVMRTAWQAGLVLTSRNCGHGHNRIWSQTYLLTACKVLTCITA